MPSMLDETSPDVFWEEGTPHLLYTEAGDRYAMECCVCGATATLLRRETFTDAHLHQLDHPTGKRWAREPAHLRGLTPMVER